jgi:hypothetical protein
MKHIYIFLNLELTYVQRDDPPPSLRNCGEEETIVTYRPTARGLWLGNGSILKQYVTTHLLVYASTHC